MNEQVLTTCYFKQNTLGQTPTIFVNKKILPSSHAEILYITLEKLAINISQIMNKNDMFNR